MTARSNSEGGWGWLIAIAGMLVTSLNTSATRCYSVFYAPLMNEFHATYAQVSFLPGIFIAGWGGGSLVSALIYKRITYRQGVMAGGFISAVSVSIAANIGNLWSTIWLTGFIPGLMASMLSLGTYASVSNWFERRRNTAMQMLCSGASIGAFIYCPVYQLLIDDLGWRGAFQIISGLYLNVMVVGSLLRPTRPTFNSDHELAQQMNVVEEGCKLSEDTGNDERSSLAASTCSQVDDTAEFPEKESCLRRFYMSVTQFAHQIDLPILFKVDFQVYSVTWILFSVAYQSSLSFLVSFGREELHLTDIKAATLVSAVSFGELGSRFLIGLFFDKLNTRRRMTTVAITFFALACVFICLPFAPDYLVCLGICAAIGLGAGGMDAVFAVFIVDVFGLDSYNAVFAYSSCECFVASAIITVLMGVAIDAFDRIQLAFFIGVGALLTSSLTMLLLRRLVDKSSSKKVDVNLNFSSKLSQN